MDVSIIIVNYNTKSLTINCVQSILDFTIDVSYEIIIIDNASTDGTLSEIGTLYPDIKIIGLQENVGFGRANNAGSEVAKGEFLFFLNSDTLFVENSLKKMIDFFRTHEMSLNLGVLGCILVDEQLNTNGFGSQFPQPKIIIWEFFKRLPLISRLAPSQVVANYPLDSDFFQIDYVIGADMFMRSELFENFHGFDSDYFMYYEESDLQLRLHRSGYKNFVYNGTRIVHLEDGSGKVQKNYSNRKRIVVQESRLLYMKKNFPKDYFLFKIFVSVMLLVNFFNFSYTFRENWNYFRSVVGKY